MKKSLIAIAALAAAGAAAAQSSVTLYGVIDTSYGFQRDKIRSAGVTESVRNNGVLSGSAGNLSGSRWGLKGQEDLGNGLSAVFNVEAGFNSANGSFNQGGFNRRSVVGLKGGFGQVVIGRDYTPMDTVLGGNGFQAIDLSSYNASPNVYDANGVLVQNGVGLYTARADGIHYSGDFSGLKAQVFAGQIRTRTKVAGTTTADNKTEGYGLGLGYANGPFAVHAAVQHFRTKDTTTPIGGVATVASAKNTEYGVGIAYDFTAAKVYGHYAANKPKGEKAFQQYSLGVDVPVEAVTLGAQYAYNRHDDVRGHDYALQAVYSLSKRTDLYARAARYNSFKIKHTDNKIYSDVYSVGVRHRF